MRTWISALVLFLALAILWSSTYAMIERRVWGPPPASVLGIVPANEPVILSSGGDTTWLQVHNSDSYCPGDPNMGHGGEASGGPNALETWCFEGGPGDSCGTNAPWDTRCFTHIDVRTLPSPMNIDYWHVDTYRTSQRPYCGSYALWCGSSATWDGDPVECGTWADPPGYGNQWNCHVQLSLDADFDVAAGCTVYFDPRYDLECKYDYFYIDYLSTGPAPTYLETWKTLAVFNGTSETDLTVCGDASRPNPDYYGFGDRRGAFTCNWVNRTTGYPAFKGIITAANLGALTEAPKFRWRVTSDGAWSDADGRGDTDGAAYLDNVMICGDNPAGPGNASVYTEDFESGTLDPSYWSKPDPPGVIDQWHVSHDPDPPYEGGDGGSRTTCSADSSFVYRARPDRGYRGTWKNGWYYRLMTPRFAAGPSGVVIQYDQWVCYMDYTCDYTDTKVRVHDSAYGRWCPWQNLDGYILPGCFYPNYNDWDDLTYFRTETTDSMQFAWDVMDVSMPGETCRGKHAGTEFLVDNVSIGYFDGNATRFRARGIDILHDSMLPQVDQAYNSFFDAYSVDTVAKYSAPARQALPKYQQMWLDVTDDDSLLTVEIVGSVDGGVTWVARTMTLARPYEPQDPLLGGEYYGTLKSGDFWPGTTDWPVGTACWYYVRATDNKDSVEYFPARANTEHPDHGGVAEDYFEFTILPKLAGGADPKILLVDGHNRKLYDWSPCLTVLDHRPPLEDIYEATLDDAGYYYDKFDISGAGSNMHIHPIIFDYYDAVVWFTGPYFSNYLFDKEAQCAIRSALNEGGKFVFCGDRIAYCLTVVGEDSLGGEFLGGVMGATYQEEVEGAFDKPFQYVEAVETLSVFGTPVAVALDTMVVYRECPYLKDMTYVDTKSPACLGYTAQALLEVLNPGPTYPNSDAAIYTEYQGRGQAVFVNFDLCSSVNHATTPCSGVTPPPVPDFLAGSYSGRVELMRVILEDLFGLPSSGSAGIPTRERPGSDVAYHWALGQSGPNPLVSRAEIGFEVGATSRVSIKVFSATGQLVKVLKDEPMAPGRYVTSWDGRNQAGDRVSSGVYFYTLDGGEYRATRKMLVVR